MRKVKNLISLVVVFILCVALVGCGAKNFSSPEGPTAEQAANENNDYDIPLKPTDDTEAPPDTTEQDETEPPASDSSSDSYDPATGMYRHEVCGGVFYTEHDINQWIHGDMFDFAGMCEEFGLTKIAAAPGITCHSEIWYDDYGHNHRQVSLVKSGDYDYYNAIEIKNISSSSEYNSTAIILQSTNSLLTIDIDYFDGAQIDPGLAPLALYALERFTADGRVRHIFNEISFDYTSITTY